MTSTAVLRDVSPSQLDQLIELACRIWVDDPAFSMLFTKHHDNRIENVRVIWRLILRYELAKAGTVITVVRDVSEAGEGQYVGLGIWQRHGTSAKAKSWQVNSLHKRLLMLQVALEYWYRLLVGSLPASKVRELMGQLNKAQNMYPAERWRLCWLGVCPDARGRGVGRELIRWGLDRSDEEAVPTVLEASNAGAILYKKYGFREIGRQSFDNGKHTQPIMLRDVVGSTP
ncbi:hypothetical protein JMJ77_0006332 [Colletotrichum scovillei]|uniref:N-acetyltransferase domain-containing protein n=1 Tax=Colletotrichum scovillei TaxID=1209932 RepID=A0A9P7RKF4_9PEZI|nr:hypothetical protein JMJ77_0006332 [Colletotrichum scovillei]KAG7077614.1 hypothetical protein JMJ76_0014859 [Colletotrichum scovillei]KAG7084670.1 hypothetical protein JMJ78_0010103 [Colletotrichum scovillei]